METVYRDYAPKGVKFYYLYKALAHPGLNGYISPLTLEERLMHIEEAKGVLGSGIPWLCDNMDNELRQSLGTAPNSEFLLGPDGKILSMRLWSEPDDLRRDLEEHVGPVEKRTQVSDLNMKRVPLPDLAPKGVVPLLKRQGQYRALFAEPHLESSKRPFYVKLRAEADQDLLRTGEGKLYLGFFPDPIYRVHWNNEVAPVRYEITAPDGLTASPPSDQFRKIEEKADADPREFLLDVKLDEAHTPVNLAFHYYACSEKWCVPVSQEYTLKWDADPAGGRAMTGRTLDPATAPQQQQQQDPVSRMMERDANDDGAIQREEMPPAMAARFDQMDANGDGSVTREEMEAMRGRMQGRPNFDRNGDGKVTKDELPPPMQQRFGRMDANGDGVLDQQELQRMRQRR